MLNLHLLNNYKCNRLHKGLLHFTFIFLIFILNFININIYICRNNMEEFDFIWDSESEGIENNIINSTEASAEKGAGVEDIINSDEDIFPKEKPATEVDKDNLELENVRNSLFSTGGVTLGESSGEDGTIEDSTGGSNEEPTGNEGLSTNSFSSRFVQKWKCA